MSDSFTFSGKELKILKNFSVINLSTVIKPDQFSSVSPNKETVALYDLENAYEFEEFGVYNLPILNNMVNSVGKLDMNLDGKILKIKDLGKAEINLSFNTSPIEEGEAIPIAKEPVTRGEPVCVFNISSEFIATFSKMLEFARHETITIESYDDGELHFITSDEQLNNSEHICSLAFKDEDITTNNLVENIYFAKFQYGMLLGDSDYKVEIFQSPTTGNYMSRWTNQFFKGLRYYISLERH